MSAHTPGPWDFFVGNANGKGLIRIEGHCDSPEAGHHIASMPRGDVSEANAQLIAAAPDMLAALQAIEHGLRDTRSARDQRMTIITKVEAHALALAAITKATGR